MNRDLVAIGASAGGVEALKKLAADLPADLPAALLIVVHVSADGAFYLPQILDRAGPLHAVVAEEGMKVEHGRIIVARPGLHMLLRDGHIHLGTGPKENRSKPAIDPLFRSVAANYGGRAIGVILTGWLNDGTSGLYAVKQCGGLAVAQSPEDALVPEMPKSAIANVAVDYTVTIDGLGELLSRLTREEAGPNPEVPSEIAVEIDVAARGGQSIAQTVALGNPSIYTCAECGGILTEIANGGDLLRFRCHTGHAFTAESLAADQSEAIDRALLSALKTMEERAAMWSRLADRNKQSGNRRSTIAMGEKAHTSEAEAELIRTLLDGRRDRANIGVV